MQISVIIPTYNRNAILAESLPYLYRALQSIDGEIIIVNDSKTQAAEAPAGSPVPLRIVNNPGQGPASARNYGASLAQSSLLLFLDDDVWVNAVAIQRTLQLHASQEHAAFNPNWKYPDALVQQCRASKFGRYLLYHKLDRYEGWVTSLDWKSTTLFAVPKLAGFYFSVNKEDFSRVGGFNENFLFQGAEDSEFSKRLAANGVKMFVDPETMVEHNEADRMTLRSRLNRTIASGYNRRIAADAGLEEYAITHSALRLKLYRIAFPFRGMLLLAADSLPNANVLDPLYRRLVNRLIGISLYQGYYLRNKKMYS